MALRFLLSILIPSLMAIIQCRILATLVTEQELSRRRRRFLFAWGATGAILLSIVIQLFFLHLQWPNTRGDAAARTLFDGAVIAPLSEELVKALPLIFLLFTNTIRCRRTFLVAGMLSAIGFFWSETLIALIGAPGAKAWSSQLWERAMLRGFNHAFFTGFCALGFGFASIQVQRNKRWVFLGGGFLLSVLVHGVNNAIGVAGMFGLARQASESANRLTLFMALFYLLIYINGRKNLRKQRVKEIDKLNA